MSKEIKLSPDEIRRAFTFPAVALLLIGGLLALWFFTPNRLDVVAAATFDEETGTWTLKGRVIGADGPVKKASVWAIASDDLGNRYSPKGSELDDKGEFTIDLDPKMLGATSVTKGDQSGNDSTGGQRDDPVLEQPDDPVLEQPDDPTRDQPGKARSKLAEKAIQVQVHAHSKVEGGRTLSGKSVVTLGDRGSTRWVTASGFMIGAISTLFILSLVAALALVRLKENSLQLKVLYYSFFSFVFVFTLIVIAGTGEGLRYVDKTASRSEVVALGFAYIYNGTYVEGERDEWLFSLTSPPPNLASDQLALDPSATERPLSKGFGVPLWVMFLSVLGAGMFTLIIIVKGVEHPIDFGDMEAIRAKAGKLVGHQFYILFAPLGAIFVYQTLVEVDAASNQLAVAFAALAAGTTQNVVLEAARRQVGKALGTELEEKDKDAQSKKKKDTKDKSGEPPSKGAGQQGVGGEEGKVKPVEADIQIEAEAKSDSAASVEEEEEPDGGTS